jgi:hypothetical protein
MKKFIIFTMFAFLLVSMSWALNYTQTVPITNSSTPQTITFNYYDAGNTLVNVRVELYQTVTGGSIAADNDDDVDPATVTLTLGATYDLTDNLVAPRLLNGIFGDVWGSVVQETFNDNLTANVGDEGGSGHPLFDSSVPDGTFFAGTSPTDLDADDINTTFFAQYVGVGTFSWTLNKTQINNVSSIGGSVDGSFSSIDLGGYVRLIYSDDQELPVVLSDFAAIQTQNDFAQIEWTTQSENNMLGYNVYRSYINEQSSAGQVNPEIIEAQNSSASNDYSFTDESIDIETTYFYWLEAVDMDGTNNFFGPVSVTIDFNDEDTPGVNENIASHIQSIFPNPFNPTTNIAYYVDQDTNVKIEIYNLKGQLINTMDEGMHLADTTDSVTWNGTSSTGETVSSGIYLFKFITNETSQLKKAILHK